MPKLNSNHHIPTETRKVRYRYVPVEQTLKTEEHQSYVTFGISVRTVEDEVTFISDLSTDFEAVSRLAELCTEQELDPVHLSDVIEDFLAEETLTV